ncbi:Rho GTPase (Miro-like) [Legionella beliardensis]|uniref:Rho GTPase (Miro-like) n=1 Tax=Legionella beliardensis TaxID=91822 RepID=A0A378I153_9GAMM|nr:DUF5617 domain-containing protein [Legionella beliardensis]STX28692.1 Rho GTPase (Miro-like) [Legionella beliardensis]
MTNPIKVCVIGPEGSGKTQLTNLILKRPYRPSYESTLVLDNYVSDDGEIKIVDTTGKEEYKSLLLSLSPEKDVFLYCVDLSQEIEPNKIAKELRQFKLTNDQAKFILVGTKADSYLGDNPTAVLQELKDNILDIDDLIVMSASEDHESRIAMANEIIALIYKQANEIAAEKEKSLAQAEAFRHIMEETKKEPEETYPDSYSELWLNAKTQDLFSAKGKERIVDSNFSAALALLKDYCKTKAPESRFATLFSKVSLAATLHKRHHTNTVRNFLKDYSGTPTVNALLTALGDELITAKNPIKPTGSLATRLQFIKDKAEITDTCDIDEINSKIERLNVDEPPAL